jgi:DNA-binding NarL/FixJ family response regulator
MGKEMSRPNNRSGAKLTPHDVDLVRQLSPFMTAKQIAEKFEMSPRAIRDIIRKKSWREDG